MKLEQGTANRLRAAWLDAKRDDVLLTQQDFAGRVIDRGLDLPLVEQASQVEESAAGENAPRTLKVDQGTANRLRTAWLDAKRDDVLLTQQDFAGRVIEAGLVAEERVQQRSRSAAPSA